MIRLTYISGKAISVSPELIKAVIEDENFTHILFGPDDRNSTLRKRRFHWILGCRCNPLATATRTAEGGMTE